ncbi:hypothetical protein OEA41_004538 [Lepraria neglecta]|uniref:Uncharacterized protein n=1 Tax=Lepraria neglecta TaxID=209136 RepID=A0AAD9Z0H1_9LECA|nr:hypothetical protein OEA41_004538 [Lepraria neglecta]
MPSEYTKDETSRRAGQVKPQLNEWVKKKEKHEQVAVGEKTSRSKKNMKAFVDDKGRRIEGRRD